MVSGLRSQHDEAMAISNEGLAAIVAIAVLCGCIYLEIQSRAAARREASYQAALRSYQEMFPPGTARVAIESKLRLSGTQFHGICCDSGGYSDEIQIGRESAPWYCSYHNVYISFQFNAKPSQSVNPEPDDVLKTAAVVHRLGVCL